MADLADTITNIPLFSGLSREDIAKILGKLEEVNLDGGTTIFSQGDKGDSFYLIESGAVEVVLESAAGRNQVIGVLGPRDWFGEMALLSGDARTATIKAVAATTLWRLSREALDELIEKHPSWMLQFCTALIKRLTRAERQFSQGRDAFNHLAERYYERQTSERQRFLRRAALLDRIDEQATERLLQLGGAKDCLYDLKACELSLVQSTDGEQLELHPFFRNFLQDKLSASEGQEATLKLHAQISAQYEALGDWERAVDHSLKAQDWPRARRLLVSRSGQLNDAAAAFVKRVIDKIPGDYFLATPAIVHLKAEAMAMLGDLTGAVETYKNVLARKPAHGVNAEAVARYQSMAEALADEGEIVQALQCLRSALNLTDKENAAGSGELSEGYRAERRSLAPPPSVIARTTGLAGFVSRLTRSMRGLSFGRWFGGILGLAVWSYLWFWTPDIGLNPAATKQLGLLSLTLIYWVFWVFPDYGVALIFALGIILTGLGKADVVLSGFASTSWFMTLGVLGLGAAITSSGLFYRLSLRLVRIFPLNYSWQIIALGFMGIVVMALIPQQSARTAIISQMLVNLSESLGYKNPSKASTGMFVASFLGLGHLGFLFLTGSTTSLIAWGLLPADVRAKFTWGYWFLAALPPTLVVVAIILAGTLLLYRPESRAQVSYRMVENQLGVLGPLSTHEWITLVVLCFTIVGWLTTGYHKIDGAWISLAALCVLVNTGVLGWGMVKKGIDWEMLICMGATLAIPTLLTEAKIDKWLVSLIAPLILPFVDYPALCFLVIALITYVIKLAFTSFLTVVTLCVALLPLAGEMGVDPWVMAMIVLIASEVWFFPFQVDWHTMAYSTTDGKGFSYGLMYRINPFYAVAYIVGLMAAIPYWRYLGLMR